MGPPRADGVPRGDAGGSGYEAQYYGCQGAFEDERVGRYSEERRFGGG
jgi:hypothetical protein